MIVVGYGDGSVANAIAEKPAKDVYVIRLPGDPEEAPITRGHVAFIRTPEDCKPFVLQAFGSHQEIPCLGGCSVVDDHPISEEAAVARAAILPALRLALGDMPQLYGNDILDSFMGLYHAALNAPTLLPAATITDIAGRYGMTPAISIGAGPSLTRHLDELRELQDKCILVACDAVLPGLLKAGIQPHYVTPLERLGANAVFSQGAEDTRCVFAGLPVCHPDTLAPFRGRVLGVAGLDRVYDWLWPGDESRVRIMTGSSTGVLSVSIALAVTMGPVYLVGHDLAKEGGVSHWGAAELATSDFRKMEQATVFGTGYERRLVPGNCGEMVESIAWWDRFRGEISLLCAALKMRKVINVAAHDRVGAVIPGALVAPLPDPATLETFYAPLLPGHTGRLEAWRTRAKELPADGIRLYNALADLRNDVEAERGKPYPEWQIGALSDRMSLTAGVSEPNHQAFSYTLRSALHNEMARHHVDLSRTRDVQRAKWLTLDGIDSLAGALMTSLERLSPCLERIARV